MDDFEQFLKAQPFRAPPAAWRAEILAAAKQAQPSRVGAVISWCRALLWPSPVAWGALAAAWAVIFVFNAATQPKETRVMAGGPAPTQQEVVAALIERRREVETFFQTQTVAAKPQPRMHPDAPGACLRRRETEQTLCA